MSTQFDIIKRPERWTTIGDYLVWSYYNPSLPLIAPRKFGFKHVEVSAQYDALLFQDEQNGHPNRADKYISRKP